MAPSAKFWCGNLTLAHEVVSLNLFLFLCPRCIIVLQEKGPPGEDVGLTVPLEFGIIQVTIRSDSFASPGGPEASVPGNPRGASDAPGKASAKLFQEIGLPRWIRQFPAKRARFGLYGPFPGWNLSIKLHSGKRMEGHGRLPAAPGTTEPRLALDLRTLSVLKSVRNSG